MPFEQPHPLRPAPDLKAMAEDGPVHQVKTRAGDQAWLVTGYEEIRSLYSGNVLGRSHPRPDRAARHTASALFGGRPREHYATEDRDRAQFKAVLRSIMSPAALRELRPWVDAVVTNLLDELAAGPKPADFVDKVAVPLPTLVICKLLGVPDKDLIRYRRLTDAIASATDEQRSAAGLAELIDHLRELVATGKITADGFLHLLHTAPYSLPAAAVAEIGASMLFTGHHTTVVAIGYGALLLLTNPVERQAALNDPAKLPDVIEECLRTGNVGVNTGGGNGIPTYARKDIDIAGVRVRTGELVLLDTGAANFDRRAFDDAYRFDVGRPAVPHLTFGHGRHYCPGAGLARMEMNALFTQLLPRFATMRLAGRLQDLRGHDDQITGGLVALPVTW
jgi:pentalenolactone synthase